MKVLYKSDDTYLIKIEDNLYYYGNGKTINGFGESAVQFLRFNPYLDDMSEQEVEIPHSIVLYIEKHKTK